MLLHKRKNRYYKGAKCSCGVEITTGSKSGKCRRCSASKPKKIPLNKTCLICQKQFDTYPSRLTRLYCSVICKVNAQEGRKMSADWCKRQSESRKGKNSHFWRGGISDKDKVERTSYKYRIWRTSVFERDNYTCQICNVKGVYLQADHIKPFFLYKEDRYDIKNGRTLCIPCHKKTPTYAGKMYKYRDIAQ